MVTESPMLMCLRNSGKNHSAKYWGKYNVTKEMFPPSFKYPDYCNGQCAVINRKALLAIEQQIQQTDINSFRIEDIYFTGILRQKAKIDQIEDFIQVMFRIHEDIHIFNQSNQLTS